MSIFQGRAWRKHELLANSQRRIGQFDVAMATVVDGLMLDLSSLAQAAYVWIRIKYDLSKVDVDSTLILRWAQLLTSELDNTFLLFLVTPIIRIVFIFKAS